MAAVPITDYAAIESLQGGSARYDSDPDALNDIAHVMFDPFKFDVWTKSTKELAKHEDDPVAQRLRAKLQADVDLNQLNPRLAQKQRVLKALQESESLSGSIGFENFTKKPQLKIDGEEPRPATMPKSAYAWGYVANIVVYTTLELHTNTHSGSGHAWGLAGGAGVWHGTLSYNNYDADSYDFGNAICGAYVKFKSGGRSTADFVGILVGVGAGFGVSGSWSW